MSSSTSEKDLDLGHADRGVWLVKVPKYIANKWDRAPGNIEVAKLRITKYVFQFYFTWLLILSWLCC